MELEIKRHPRCNLPKTIFKGLSFQDTPFIATDASGLLKHAEVIYSPGSSLMAQALWEDKLVILDKRWADKLSLSFIFEDCCSLISEAREIVQPKLFDKARRYTFLCSRFQMGLGKDEYRSYLVATLRQKLKKIMD